MEPHAISQYEIWIAGGLVVGAQWAMVWFFVRLSSARERSMATDIRELNKYQKEVLHTVVVGNTQAMNLESTAIATQSHAIEHNTKATQELSKEIHALIETTRPKYRERGGRATFPKQDPPHPLTPPGEPDK